MDPRFRGFSSSVDRIQLGRLQSGSVLSNQNIVGGPRVGPGNTFIDHSYGGIQFLPDDPRSSNVVHTQNVGTEDDLDEDCDFSDAVLRYISQMLMEEDMEDQTCMLQESLGLQAAERSFYEVLGKKYPPSPEHNPELDSSVSDHYFGNHSDWINGGGDDNHLFVSPSSSYNPVGYSRKPHLQSFPVYNSSLSSNSSLNSTNNFIDGFLDSPISPLQVPDLYNGSQSIWNFRRGVEEANKFLPSGDKLLVNVEVNGLSPHDPRGKEPQSTVKLENKDDGYSPTEPRGRKNPYRDDVDLEEERSSKLAAVYTDSTVRSEMFDVVLLHSMGEGKVALTTLQDTLHNEASKSLQQNGQSRGPSGGKGRGRKQNGRKEVIDLRTLLITCAQAVAADDHRSANELLKQIRQHSSAFGDGNQRLTHCLANGLEARLAGTGSQIYKALVNKRASAADFLKAYHLYLASCPFRKISNFVTNKTIMTRAKSAMRIHIIDFGILYGFQWPTFFQRIATRDGGPPKVRITGIEFPQPGFRPAERVEETGRRLAAYARMFDVPFEYNAIAMKWETIKIEDLKLDKDEFVAVNCLYRSQNLLDETVVVESSRSVVLNLIRKISPDIFIHGIVNGAYNAPFFVTRFREALFHFSALFDMLETNVSRERSERMLIEREIFGREALNVIACEGWERVERPETYKQWQVRGLRAGFLQIPWNREIVHCATKKVNSSYHKDFVIDEDSQWLLQGWKGRIIYALSCWKPV